MEASKLHVSLEDYYAFVDLHENRDREFELIDGEFVEKMGSYIPAYIATLISTYINLYLFSNPIGRASGADGAFRMSNLDMLIPDVAFVSLERMPALPDRVALIPPDFAVEVKSPNDKTKTLRLKAQRYLDNGTLLVWLVFPETRTVEVYDGDHDVVTLGIEDTLTGGDILPGFTLRVADIFDKVSP